MTAVLERIPNTSLDPFSDEFFADPYPRYEELRELGPAFYIEKYGVYGAARHADVMAILLDPATFISGAGAGIHDLRKGDAWRPPSILLEADPPLHDQTRGVMNRVLSGPAIQVSVAEREQVGGPDGHDLLHVLHVAVRRVSPRWWVGRVRPARQSLRSVDVRSGERPLFRRGQQLRR